MGKYKDYYPDGPDGQIVPVDTGEIHRPIAYELQQRATQILGEAPLFPMAADDEDPEDAWIRQGQAWFDALPPEEQAKLQLQDANIVDLDAFREKKEAALELPIIPGIREALMDLYGPGCPDAWALYAGQKRFVEYLRTPTEPSDIDPDSSAPY